MRSRGGGGVYSNHNTKLIQEVVQSSERGGKRVYSTTIVSYVTELVLKQEQEEYAREGIQWSPVQYFNNRVICELVDAPHQGIIAIMDEACLNPTKVRQASVFDSYLNKDLI